MPRRLKPGDVLSLPAPTGLVYLHYLGQHREYGDAVLVCPVMHPVTMPVTDSLFVAGYVTFFPANAAISQNLASLVGQLPPPGIPGRFRRPGVRSAKGIETWIIEDGESETLKRHLTTEETKIPIAAIWNHELLLDRVLQGWRPELEGTSSEKPDAPPPREASHEVSHYLYFPTEEAALEASEGLKGKGYAAETRISADGINWLVLATHTVAPSGPAMDAARTTMEAVAGTGGGQYDGWETNLAEPPT